MDPSLRGNSKLCQADILPVWTSTVADKWNSPWAAGVPPLYVIAQPSGASRKGKSDVDAAREIWALHAAASWPRRARSGQTVQLARLIEEVIGTARQLAEQNAIGSTVTISSLLSCT